MFLFGCLGLKDPPSLRTERTLLLFIRYLCVFVRADGLVEHQRQDGFLYSVNSVIALMSLSVVRREVLHQNAL
ncbi:MAG TPA: hypothetical protein DEF21_11320 [Thalassospira lucentensis]|uniref:Uncharacterized protein n=1 Tax=Thalassospira lucentensis TaxID=168935 RepID=A0A358HTH6_9PROT|nr:hypothetical protein [Thalassospira lucentensis]